jgi:thiol-disulfide isomerase/thioredoxin
MISLLLGFGMYQHVVNEKQVDTQTLSGEKINWSEQSWSVINFFAEWCAPCLREIPELNTFQNTLPANTRLFMVSYDFTTEDKLRTIANKYDIRAPIIINKEGMNLPVSVPNALPATFIISPTGEIAHSIYGEVTNAELQTLMSEIN